MRRSCDMSAGHGRPSASEAVMAALSPMARAIVLLPRARLTAEQRQFHERVDLTRVDAALPHRARSIKVVKRPGG